MLAMKAKDRVHYPLKLPKKKIYAALLWKMNP